MMLLVVGVSSLGLVDWSFTWVANGVAEEDISFMLYDAG